MATAPAHAATSACGTIANTAYMREGADAATRASNAADLVVAKLLDVRLGARADAQQTTQGAVAAVPFELVNTGNGAEAFVLSGRFDGLDGTVQGFAVDSNGNGSFDSASDTRLAAGVATAPLAAGEHRILFALVEGAAAGSGTLIVTARAATGTGAPGTAFAGQGGAAGCDAVVGATGATSQAQVTITVDAGGTGDVSQISLVKSQQIAAPDGSATPVAGATVTYSIAARFDGTGTFRNVRIADPLPAGTRYAPGSLRIDGTPLSDADDQDAGRADASGISVALGNVAAPASHTVTFQVKVQ